MDESEVKQLVAANRANDPRTLEQRANDLAAYVNANRQGADPSVPTIEVQIMGDEPAPEPAPRFTFWDRIIGRYVQWRNYRAKHVTRYVWRCYRTQGGAALETPLLNRKQAIDYVCGDGKGHIVYIDDKNKFIMFRDTE